MIRNIGTAVLFIVTLLTLTCSGQTEEQALVQLREITRDGKLPPENVVANIESRFAGKRTGALAKLLHARIKFENGDFAGAAALLNTDVFRKKTKIADHVLWLRGKALQSAGDHAGAMNVFSESRYVHARQNFYGRRLPWLPAGLPKSLRCWPN